MAVRNKGSARGKGRKAVFFTLSSIIIVSLFMLYFSTQGELTVKEKAEIQEFRVSAVNEFAKNFENVYFPRALYATSQKALYSLTERMIERSENTYPNPYVNLSRDFHTVLVNGTIYNEETEEYEALKSMEESTLEYWLEKLTNVSRQEMNLYAEFNITRIVINQTKPWYANVTAYLSYNITSPGVVRITKEDAAISTEFSIQGFTDPLIAVETGVKRKINRSSLPIEEESEDLNIDAGDLIDSGSYIFQNKTAPSFLMRFEKNLNASPCCGIETLISPEIYTASGYSGKISKAFTGYQFLVQESADPPGLCYDWNLDEEDTLYNITLDVATNEFPFRIDEFHTFMIYTKGRSEETKDSCT